MNKARTLRWRMIFLFCAVVGAMLIGSYLGFFLFLARHTRDQLNRQLLATAAPIIADLVANPGIANVNLFNLEDQYFEVVDSNGRIVQESKNLAGRALALDVSHLDRTDATFRMVQRNGRAFWTALVPYQVGKQTFVLAVAVPNREAKEVLETFGTIMALFLPLSLIVTAWLSVWYVKKSLEPITALTQHARRMTEILRSDQREMWTALPVERPDDELGHLAQTFNQLFSQIDAVVRQLRQFVTDASHELRTPLSVLRGETELMLSQPRTNREYERTLQVIDGELRKLTRIVEGLFTISMADAGQLEILREPVYLSDILEEACALAMPRAHSKDIRIVRSFQHEVAYEGDEAFLRQLFLIFLDNAIKYSRPKTSICVRLEHDGETVRVQFKDEGIGISDSELPHIFERFYRAAVRSSGEAHSGGLGLAIAQAIVRAHQGSISCQSTAGHGSTFTVNLPLVNSGASAVSSLSSSSLVRGVL